MNNMHKGPGSNKELEAINKKLDDFIELSNQQIKDLHDKLLQFKIIPIMTGLSDSVAGIKKSLDSTNKAIKQFKPQQKNKINKSMASQISRIRNSHLR